MVNFYNSFNTLKGMNSKRTWAFKTLLSAFFVLFGVLNIQAQITVSVDNPTNTTPNLSSSYVSLSSALTDLNNVSAMSGPVTLTLSGNEIVPATGLTIGSATLNPVLNATNTVTLLASGTVTLNAGVGVSTPGSATPDGILKIVGADWITINGLTFTDGNVANPATMEYGIGLFKLNLSDGASNNTVKNCVFNMQRINNASGTAPMVDGSVGILMVNSIPTAATTALVPTTAAGSNSNNKYYSNTINGGNIGIALIGYAAATPFTAADTNNDVGGSSLATGNSILNFGGGGTTNPAAGVRTLAQYAVNVSYNTINNNDGAGVNHGATIRGIYLNTATSASATVNNNTVSIKSGGTTSQVSLIENVSGSTAASNTITISNNTFTGCSYTTQTSGTVYGIYNNGATPANLVVSNNVFNPITLNTVAGSGGVNFIYVGGTIGTLATVSGNTFVNQSLNTTGTVYLIYNSNGTNSFNISNNAVSGTFAKTGAGGTLYGYYNFGSPTGGTATISNNNFSNISVTGATTFYGIRQYTSVSQIENISNNIISNITGGTSAVYGISHGYGAAGSIVNGNSVNSITSTGTINGINLGDGTAGTADCYNNTVYGLTSTGASAVVGISNSLGVTNNIFKNKVYNLEANNALGTVNGVLVASGTTVNVYNNIVGDLRTPIANAANLLIGINISGGTTVNTYYNTVRLAGSSTGALFGSSAISASTTPTVTLRNNIFVNNSSVSGAGLATAYRRSGTSLTTYGASSNNNLFYGSTFFTDGTNTDATFAAFKTRVGTRDVSSISENPTFVSTVGSNAQFLHIDTAVPTQIEGSAAPIATYTDDFDGDVRNASTPDIGADEFAGIPIAVVVINSVGITPTGNLCTASNRTVTANITAGGNDITSVVLNYFFNGVAQPQIVMTGGTLTAGTTSTFSGVIPVAAPVNASVTWNVTAADALTTKATSGTSYQDEPLFGTTATSSASVTSYCNTGTSVLSANLMGNGVKTIGAGASTTTVSGTSSTNYVSPFTHYFGGYKAQYIIRASELTSAGFLAGSNLTSLAFDVTTAGTTYNGFTLSLGNVAATVLTTTFNTSSTTQVYNGNLNVGATGLLTLPFGTGAGSSSSFVWDGTSNVLVNLCWSNNNTGGTAAEVKYDATSFVAMAYYRVDSNTQAAVCSTATATSTQSNRPKMIFGGNFALPITSISWSDGSTVVGTGNNLSVSPTTTTTYTATLTALGCTINTNAATVTVNTVATPTVSTTVQPTCSVPTGTVVVTAPIGATLEYSINGVAYQAGTSFSGVAPGTYNVTVRNTATGCVSSATSVTVNAIPAAPSAPTAAVSAQPTCSVTTGTIDVSSPLGATLEYSIDGVTYQSSTTFAGLASGSYNVTVRNTVTGCISSATSVTVNAIPAAPSAPTAAVSAQPTCSVTTGTIDVSSPLGATLEYSIDGVTYQSSTTFAGLASGSYNVTVRDTATGCVSSAASVTINAAPVVPGAPTGSSTQTISVPVPTDATIEDIVVSGSNIIWYPTDPDALAGTNALPAGTQLVSGSTYYATQTVGSCTSTSTLAVTVTVTLGINDFALNSLKLYPNPVATILNIENGQTISGIEIYNFIGEKVMVKTINAMSTSVDMSGLAGGTYLVKVISDNAFKTIKLIKK